MQEINDDVEKKVNNVGGRGFRREVDERGSEGYETDSSRWRKWIPHTKRGGEEAAGFNLDYLPPRTHPPVHN